MLVMLACGVLLIAGVALAWRWRGYSLALPGWAAPASDPPAPGRALAWLASVALLTGLLVGALVVGPAGRLAMRLLAATSSDAAQGRVTDADQVVGEITVGGTVAFFVFVGLPFGLVVGLVYALTAFVLPRGVVGGVLFGAAVLVIFGSTLDPLRKDNPDFDILEPGWLSVATFCAMAVLTGAVTAPIAGRIGAALGPPRLWWAAWLVPAGLVAAAATANSPAWVTFIALAGCAVFVAALLVPPARRETDWRRGRCALQVVLAAAVLATAPGFIAAVSSIAA